MVRDSIVGFFVGTLVTTIFAVQVLIPVVSEGISNLDQSLNMVVTLLNLIPVIVALLVLIVFVRPIVRAGS